MYPTLPPLRRLPAGLQTQPPFVRTRADIGPADRYRPWGGTGVLSGLPARPARSRVPGVDAGRYLPPYRAPVHLPPLMPSAGLYRDDRPTFAPPSYAAAVSSSVAAAPRLPSDEWQGPLVVQQADGDRSKPSPAEQQSPPAVRRRPEPLTPRRGRFDLPDVQAQVACELPPVQALGAMPREELFTEVRDAVVRAFTRALGMRRPDPQDDDGDADARERLQSDLCQMLAVAHVMDLPVDPRLAQLTPYRRSSAQRWDVEKIFGRDVAAVATLLTSLFDTARGILMRPPARAAVATDAQAAALQGALRDLDIYMQEAIFRLHAMKRAPRPVELPAFDMQQAMDDLGRSVRTLESRLNEAMTELARQVRALDADIHQATAALARHASNQSSSRPGGSGRDRK